jgi:hypothetical protein
MLDAEKPMQHAVDALGAVSFVEHLECKEISRLEVGLMPDVEGTMRRNDIISMVIMGVKGKRMIRVIKTAVLATKKFCGDIEKAWENRGIGESFATTKFQRIMSTAKKLLSNLRSVRTTIVVR